MSASAPPTSDLTSRRALDRPETAPLARVQSQRRAVSLGRRLAIAVGLVVVMTVFAIRCARVAWTDSITSDESTHLVHCLHFWMTGDDLSMWELGSPRLPHALNALPSYLCLKEVGMLPRTDRASIEFLVLAGLNRVLRPARFVAISWGLLLLLAVFWAVARTRGAILGLVAASLTSLVPEVLAHSAIAGSDIPFTTAAFLALVLLARYAERPTPMRWVAVSLGVGLAWAMRHSGLLLLPLAAMVHLTIHWRRERPTKIAEAADRVLSSILAGLALSAIASLALWTGDGLGTVTLEGVSERVTALNVPHHLGPIDVSNLPIPTSLLSVLKQIRHQNLGHEAFFCGEVRSHGWPLYFPVALLLKTPAGLIALLVLAATRTRPKGMWEIIALSFLGLLWLMLVRNKVNIGLRYALLTYPLAMPFVALLFERASLRDRIWGPLTLLASIWFAWASLSSPGRYLSYFNEIGGGSEHGWLYLADSNVDWGQDLDALSATIDRLGIKEITTDLSTDRRLDRPGRVEFRNPNHAQQTPMITPPGRRLPDVEGSYIPVFSRYVAVSASRLHGLYTQNDMSWLRTRKVVERVGDSIFIFDMDSLADKPIYE
jgi:hypothetical protein